MNHYRKLLLLLLSIVMLSSCSSNKHVTEYFKDIDITTLSPSSDYTPVIEPSDELMITVTSENPEATNIYNLPSINLAEKNDLVGTSNPRQQTYRVDSNGYIDMPVIGKVKVAGLTTEQLKELLTERISADVADPLVTVEMVYYYVNVLGEVQRPGRQYVSNPRYTLLDALAAAGDMTLYGRRDNVLLIREENGQRKQIRLNLNEAETLNSPYLYLKQNDYIYVEPNNVRQDNAEYNQYNSFKLSVISTITSASASIISLIIALSR